MRLCPEGLPRDLPQHADWSDWLSIGIARLRVVRKRSFAFAREGNAEVHDLWFWGNRSTEPRRYLLQVRGPVLGQSQVFCSSLQFFGVFWLKKKKKKKNRHCAQFCKANWKKQNPHSFVPWTCFKEYSLVHNPKGEKKKRPKAETGSLQHYL